MKKLLTIAAMAEVATGVACLILPSLIGQLLFGEELTGVAITTTRVIGIALISLGLACWPGNMANRALYGMLTYGTLTALYLAYIGVRGGGTLLWPAVALHAVLSTLLVWAWWKEQRFPKAKI